MNQSKPKARLYISSTYCEGEALFPSEAQSHYLISVMRLKLGDVVSVFNGCDGEWLAEISHVAKKTLTLTLKSARKMQIYSPDVWLAFAPIKNKTELVVEKATELGVTKILPVFMKHNVVTKVNIEKLIAHTIEAAEQCERMDVPTIEEHKNLGAMLSVWPADRILFYGDETGGGDALNEIISGSKQQKFALLIGPEGGFSAEEHRMLKQLPFVKAFGMGPRIMRADTAVVAALACIMSKLGDWHHKPHFEMATHG